MNADHSAMHGNEKFRAALDPSRRIVIGGITPQVDQGRYPAKRCLGDALVAEADIFADGHEKLAAQLLLHKPGGAVRRIPMKLLSNDRWRAQAILDETGGWSFNIEAWIDVYGGFARDIAKKQEAGVTLCLEAEEGRLLIAAAAERDSGSVGDALTAILRCWSSLSLSERITLLLAPETIRAMAAASDHPHRLRSPALRVEVERERAGFASWYELFPRSQAKEGHGTLRGVIDDLPRIKAMGFDILYLTPIHPIGRTNRKGRNNALQASAGDPGSPYAIGSSEGGHDAIHPELGTADDFKALQQAVRACDMEIALDIAVQMSPDHPWLVEHPKWFRRRPDGSMRYAENPPKKYEDIVTPDFYADPALWTSLRDVFLHWIGMGVKIFRIDNPHTKPLPFWEWLIADIRGRYPDTIFLSEAFTRPKMMYQLAKLGFAESYTYFTWRNSKRELTEYLTELTEPPISDFFRPHFFTNTPDINPAFLQSGGRPAFLIRAVLAATLSGLWGIYSGFEICEADPLPGREEYKDSEKYELKRRDYAAPGNIVAEISRLNAIRKAQPHLRSHMGLTFYNAFNDHILYYAKVARGRDDRILIAVNLDPHQPHECDFEIPLWEWGLNDHGSLAVEDLLHGHKFTWTGKIQHLRLEPQSPYAIWRVQPVGA